MMNMMNDCFRFFWILFLVLLFCLFVRQAVRDNQRMSGQENLGDERCMISFPMTWKPLCLYKMDQAIGGSCYVMFKMYVL